MTTKLTDEDFQTWLAASGIPNTLDRDWDTKVAAQYASINDLYAHAALQIKRARWLAAVAEQLEEEAEMLTEVADAICERRATGDRSKLLREVVGDEN